MVGPNRSIENNEGDHNKIVETLIFGPETFGSGTLINKNNSPFII